MLKKRANNNKLKNQYTPPWPQDPTEVIMKINIAEMSKPQQE